MNFFEDQRLARQKSNRLITIFLLLVVGLSISTGVVVVTVLQMYLEASSTTPPGEFTNEKLLTTHSLLYVLYITVIVAATIFITSWIKTRGLRSRPEDICRELGAKLVSVNTTDFRLKRYRNIVEEMSLASSVPVPSIYVLEDNAINAFACGYDINSAAICVTRGTLNSLSREELQAVVAHEYSHILNGDMTINLRLIGMLTGLLFVYYSGRVILRSQGHSRRKGNEGAAVLGLALIVLGLLGFLCGNLLKAAISRQREFLADASSVQFTRNPDGIAGALKKIAVNYNMGHIESASADKAAHMFLVEGIKPSFFSLATHPDIYTRIKAVDKRFNKANFLKEEYKEIKKKITQEQNKQEQQPDKRKSPISIPGFEDGVTPDNIAMLMPVFMLLQNSVNKIDPSKDPEEELVRRFVANADPEIQKLTPMQKLEILELAFGEIKSRDHEKRQRLHDIIMTEIKRDGKMDFDEFIIYAYLRPALVDVKIQNKKLTTGEFRIYGNMLLNLIWQMDKIDLTQKHIQTLSKYFLFEKLSVKDIGYSKMIKALEKLRFCHIEQKQKIIGLCESLVALNDKRTEKEEVMLKLVKQILGVPGNI